MLTKFTIIFVILFHYIEGHPLESAHPQYDVKNFLSSRIVGGQEAPEGYAKHMVALVVGFHVKSLVCGGSIISKRYVLSAAHCIEPFVIWGELSSQFKGVIGSNYWNSTNYIEFSHYKIHPKWDWATLKNDIAVVGTAKEIVFSKLVAPIAPSFDWIDGGVKCSVTGWGQVGVNDNISYKLQLLYLNTITPKQCIKGVKLAALILGGWAPPVDPDVEICTIHFKGHGMCFGDSGSALVKVRSRKQVGIVSWGMPCAHGAPDMFTRISAYADFLRKYIGKHLDE